LYVHTFSIFAPFHIIWGETKAFGTRVVEVRVVKKRRRKSQVEWIWSIVRCWLYFSINCNWSPSQVTVSYFLLHNTTQRNYQDFIPDELVMGPWLLFYSGCPALPPSFRAHVEPFAPLFLDQWEHRSLNVPLSNVKIVALGLPPSSSEAPGNPASISSYSPRFNSLPLQVYSIASMRYEYII